MRRGAVLGLAALALVGSARATVAQGVGLRRVTGELGSEFDGRWIDVLDAGGPALHQFREWIEMRLGGWALYPGIIDFGLQFSPMFNQNLLRDESTSSSGNTTILNGGADVWLLSARRLTLHGYYQRGTERSRGAFGSDSESDRSVWGVDLSDRNTYLPYQLEYRDESDDTRFVTGSSQTPVRTNLRNKLLRFTARNSKVRILLQRHAQEDRLAGVERIRSIASLRHTLRWGKGSQLSTAVNRWKNSGVGESETIRLSENVKLMHRRNLSSGYSYIYAKTATATDVQHQSLGQITTNYEIVHGIRASAGGLGDWRRTRSGTHQSLYRVTSQLTLGADLPLGARASASGRASHQWLRQGSENGLVEMVDERHPIGEVGRFQLNESFVEPASVVVKSQEGFPFQPEIDYRIVEVGAFLEIVLLPGGRIQPGETVLVDYQFRLVPGGSARALVWGYQLGLDVGPVRLFHNRSVEDGLEEVPEDVFGNLRDYDDRLFGGTLQLPFSFGSFNANAEYHSIRTNTLETRSKVVGSALQLLPGRGVRVGLSGSLSAQRGNDLSVDILRAQSSLEWNVARNLAVRAAVTYWSWREPDQRTDFLGGGIGLSARYRQLTLEARVDRRAWTNGSAQSENRISVRLKRQL
jgi:hypothetical protein